MSLSVDANGWPDAPAVTAKILTVISAADFTPAAAGDVDNTRLAVIAEFQGPQPIGTGRNFTQIVETRTFDGNGYPDLMVPDILPNSTVVATIYGVTVTDFVLKTNYRGLGSSVLTRNSDTGTLFYVDLPPVVWLTGHQNVKITATWGAVISQDILDVVACEAARRIIVASVAGTDGAGATVKIERGEFSTGGGMLNMETSTLIEWSRRYRCMVESYRDPGAWRRKALVRRMS